MPEYERPYPHLLDEIDRLRREMENEHRARLEAETGKRIANEDAERAEARLAAVEALCEYWTDCDPIHSAATVREVRAALRGEEPR